ncbi:MAG: ABC transporter permease subunit [Armatimonadota bacterium]|jgi:ABC-type transport system involved in multi-copper enzyme maturation permease subunit
MMHRLRQILAIARVAYLENLRKQVLQVTLILTIAAIGSTTLLSFFDVGVQIKILKDLSLAAILFCGGVLAVVLSAGNIPGEILSHTAYPVLARAVRRSDYVLGRYLGAMATATLCMALLAVVFLGILAVYQKTFDWAVALGMLFILIEVAVVAAIGTLFSLFVSPLVAGTLTIGVFILGQIKISYLHGAIERSASPAGSLLLKGLYAVLPNLDCFSFKDALVHNIAVPASYMAIVALYGLVYCAFILSASGIAFARRDL